MAVAKQKNLVSLPKSDPRTKPIVATIKKENARPDSLIQVLHTAQNIFGYLPLHMIQFIAQELKLPPGRVYGVVTFYRSGIVRIKSRIGATRIMDMLSGEQRPRIC